MQPVVVTAVVLAGWSLAAAQAPVSRTESRSGGKASPNSGVEASKSPTTKAHSASAKAHSQKAAAAKSAEKAASARTKLEASDRPAPKAASRAAAGAAKSAAKKAPPRRAAQQQPTVDRYREIQQALAEKGYFHGPADGTWGPESVDALKRFQADQNLDADGKIGALSLIALGLSPKRESAAARPAPLANPAIEPTPGIAEPAPVAVPVP
jgi:hypothetical protein